MQNCSIVVGNAAFTEPCLGTYKYLNVSYECILPPSAPTTNLVTCESETARLSCDQGNINVLSANYGRTNSSTCSTGKPANQLSNVQCRQSTSLSVLTTLCNGQQSCSIVVGNVAFTEPCPGTYKYLNVSYECITPPPPSAPSTNLFTCESQTAPLSCAQGTINVLSANYGRTDQTTCSTGKPANQLSNVQCTQSTSLSVLTTQCDEKPDCSISVNNAVFGDPCVGTYKYLNVSYTCVPTIIICQDKGSTITCEGNRKLNIHFANYGRRDAVTCPHSRASAMSSTCTSSQTRNLQLRCNGKRRCVLNASNSQFHDQCPHIHKYLEVSYSCD
ncbi:L-rhamnose-binding lectin CSL2-like [Triplophysa dalaica]|uniref:L-rhamnose-binding lectin CSL2-like n=1 Tax=Triplophysa dalaica TaxID=1582913 RepID=UPI0024DFD814|nr:L-rhamnose-binding lectin CSL2-like [Triplophysa dalaica]XP_056588713.1 L-rhamnose-binding lectin CSL2-like [Triplophysa dalaica]